MKYLRRMLSFVAKKMVLFSVVFALLVVCFYLAMNTANIYVLLSDGMKARTDVILTRSGAEQLTAYFTNDFLLADETLNIGLSDNSPYIDYNISSFNYQLSLESMWSWPWESTATATIVERVPKINGSVVSAKRSLVTDGTLSASPPQWFGGRYVVTCERVDGQWKIAGLRQTQLIIEPTPEPAPTATPAP